jgi:hypothetical protein
MVVNDGCELVEPMSSTRAAIVPPDTDAAVMAIVIVVAAYVMVPIVKLAAPFLVFDTKAAIFVPGVLLKIFPPVNSPDRTLGIAAAFAPSLMNKIILAKNPGFANVKTTEVAP